MIKSVIIFLVLNPSIFCFRPKDRQKSQFSLPRSLLAICSPHKLCQLFFPITNTTTLLRQNEKWWSKETKRSDFTASKCLFSWLAWPAEFDQEPLAIVPNGFGFWTKGCITKVYKARGTISQGICEMKLMGTDKQIIRRSVINSRIKTLNIDLEKNPPLM